MQKCRIYIKSTEAIVLSRNEDESEKDSITRKEKSSKTWLGKNWKRLCILTNSNQKHKKFIATNIQDKNKGLKDKIE